MPGDKAGFGTSHTTDSKVWYTLSRGTLNEVYYPRIDTPSLRDSQFVVTDGATFTDREDRDATHTVQLLDEHSLDLPPRQHGQVRRLADHQDVRHRPGAVHRAGAGDLRVAHRGAATSSTCCTTRRCR